ncbi:hypothetical protein UFOVP9_41 [uncultured Caudovirales phage]|jgi:hypothetical protein|uniref:Uncharacterized protein n=1 Tax=uncultured Caudovirales phage TaxID=2100421 RepID=A0A6J5KI79_9CAUD|nr:hypothetical protein UFOVP9_41 [uncultured Caudovirales phage]
MWFNWLFKSNNIFVECSESCVKIAGGSIIGTDGARINITCSHGLLKLIWRDGNWRRDEETTQEM